MDNHFLSERARQPRRFACYWLPIGLLNWSL